MSRKGIEKPKREMTRRERSRWQREANRNRIVFIIGVTLIVAVVLTVSIGWFITEFRPMHETILTVNGKGFNMSYYINMLKIYGKGQGADYLNILVGQIPVIIERDEVMVKGAAALGVSVTDSEIKAELKRQNLSNDHWDVIKAQLTVQKLLDNHFDAQVPKSGEQRDVMAMFLDSRSQAEQMAAALDKGEDFGSLAKQFSLDAYTKEKAGVLGWHPKDILPDYLETSVVEQFAFGSRAGTLSPPIRDDEKVKSGGYWIIKVLEAKEDQTKQVHALAIVIGNEEEAKNVKERLEKGEDFAAVAKEVSQDANSKDIGGDLGWIAQGTMGTAFDGFAFNAANQNGKPSDPVQDPNISTRGGYWLIKVTGAETDRKISDEDREALKGKALNEWVATQMADPSNTFDASALTTEKMLYAVQKASGD